MPVLLLIFLLSSFKFNFNMNRYLAEPAKYLNSTCNQITLTSSSYSGLFQSFICGKKLDKSLPKETLIKSGVYHLIVVSGGHFLFLESLFHFLKFPFFLRAILLCLYYLITGLQAPGLRALAHLLLSRLVEKYQMKISNFNLVFFSGLICLILNCSFWNSLSFWLSFSVGLALAACQSLFYNESTINRFLMLNLILYLFLFPFLIKLSYSHPFTLFLGNLLIFPTFIFLSINGVIILILELCDFPLWIKIMDTGLSLFFKILETLSAFAHEKNNSPWDWFIFWFYLFSVFVCVHFSIVIKERLETHA